MTLSVDRVDVQEFLLEFAFKTCDLFFCDPALCTAVVLDLDYIVKSLDKELVGVLDRLEINDSALCLSCGDRKSVV